jgi:virginiamycin B lyase
MDWRGGVAVGLTIAPFAALCGVVLAAQTAQTAQNSSSSTPRPVPEIQLSRLKPDAILAIALEPGAAIVEDGVWVSQKTPGAVLRIDGKTNAVGKPVPLTKQPCGALAAAFDSVWVPLCDGTSIVRVETKSGNVTATMPLSVPRPGGGLAVSVGSLWVITDVKGVVTRIDPATNTPVAEVYVAAQPTSVTATDDAVWVTSEAANVVTRIDAHTNVIVETIKVGPRPSRVALGEDAVWMLNRGDGSLTRVDPKTNKVVATIAVGAALADGDLAVGEGSVWLSARGAPIVRVDPRSNRVVQRFSGDAGGAITVAHGSLWLAAGPSVTWRLDPKLVAALRPD